TIIARKGKVIHFSAHGMRDLSKVRPMEEDSIFRIYSMTKAVVSVAAMVLVEQEKLKLDVPASSYIPSLGKMKFNGKLPKREMTLRDLLSHSSGLPNNVTTDRALRKAGHPSLAESSLEEMMNNLESVPLKYEPGKGWYYSFAADVVGRLVEIGSGLPLDKALKKLIFEPLNMKDTGFYVPKEKWHRFVTPYGNGLKEITAPQPGTSGPFTFEKPPKFLSGGGGLVSTASDYMRFCLMLTGQGKFQGNRLLSAKTVSEMFRDQLPEGVGEITRAPKGRGFGLGFAVRIRKIDSSPIGECEWLGGLGTEFFISPKDELAVITLSNQSPMRHIKSEVRPYVYSAFIKENKQSNITPHRREKYLVLDSRIIESTKNAKLTLGQITKHESNPLFVEGQPWEPRYDNMYPNVIYDNEENLYKCWYCPFIVDQRTTETHPNRRKPSLTPYMDARPAGREEALLYAISKDGLNWVKPELGLVDFKGSSKNNIVCRGLSGAGVIKDELERFPERRYKAFYCSNSGYKMRYSSDGLNWGDEVALPGVGESDCHANMIWSPELKKYVGILRHYDPIPVTGNRKIARTESIDSVTWTKSETIIEGTPQNQLHDMVIFRDGGVYLGLLGCMNYPSKETRNGVRQHIELAWSPDSYKWHRINPRTPFISNSKSNNNEYGKMPYDWGCVFPSAPVFVDDEIRIYYGASDWYFFDWRKGGLALATLGKNRWAGYEPLNNNSEAIVTTVPLMLGNRISVTADVGKGGLISVNVLDSENVTVYSQVIRTSCTDFSLSFESKSFDVAGKKCAIQFKVRGAKVYSFSIR
ncbi:MAG: serine hydrolase, partial [Verrucomicrobiota bacterium]|nr:serine hydrolase [Verrucomicrobiota bacterium]